MTSILLKKQTNCQMPCFLKYYTKDGGLYMIKNHLLDEVRKIEEIELELTIFNSKRALTKTDKKLELRKIGDCSLLCDTNSPSSIYYNRIKGFGIKDLDKLEEILDV